MNVVMLHCPMSGFYCATNLFACRALLEAALNKIYPYRLTVIVVSPPSTDVTMVLSRAATPSTVTFVVAVAS